MFISETGKRDQLCRLVSAAVLLFVFVLPLHVHLSRSWHLAEECACTHGSRAALAPQAHSPLVTPSPESTLFAGHYSFAGGSDSIASQKVRAPPEFPSV
jgi:hypothetical protein